MSILFAAALLLSPPQAMPPQADPLPAPRPLYTPDGFLDAKEMRYVLWRAGVPKSLWPEYLAVAWCESGWNTRAVGDGEQAVGLFQFWPLWPEWAEREGYGSFDRRDAVDNARLAWLVGQQYDMPRYGNRWHQWSAKPHFETCERYPEREEVTAQ